MSPKTYLLRLHSVHPGAGLHPGPGSAVVSSSLFFHNSCGRDRLMPSADISFQLLGQILCELMQNPSPTGGMVSLDQSGPTLTRVNCPQMLLQLHKGKADAGERSTMSCVHPHRLGSEMTCSKPGLSEVQNTHVCSFHFTVLVSEAKQGKEGLVSGISGALLRQWSCRRKL